MRAIFGAHPFEIGRAKKGKNRNHIGRVHYLGDSPKWLGNPEAFISRPNGQTEIFALDLNELKQFIAHRYRLLADVIGKIKSDIASFIETMKDAPIGVTDTMPPLEKLDILHEEAGADKRGKFGSGIQDEIKNLQTTFACNVTSPKNKAMVETYRKALLPIIEKYQAALQNMTFLEDWREEPLLKASELGLPDGYDYDIQNLQIGFPKSQIAENSLKALFHSKFDTSYASREEFHLLIRAYLFTHPPTNT